jgi:hypothetical protein
VDIPHFKEKEKGPVRKCTFFGRREWLQKSKPSWVLVAHACNPSYSEGREIRRVNVQIQPRQIIH